MDQTAPMEIGISVSGLDVMLDFYANVLNCTEVRRADIRPSLSAPLAVAEAGYTCVWLATPHGEHIKLMSPVTAPQPVEAPDYLSSRSGLAFFTFYCSDLTQTLATAESLGAVLRSERSLVDEGRPMRLCFLSDPEGNVFELVEVGDGEA